MGRTEADRSDYKRALVVEGEFNRTTKTIRPSERSGVPEKGQKDDEKFQEDPKKNLTEPALFKLGPSARFSKVEQLDF